MFYAAAPLECSSAKYPVPLRDLPKYISMDKPPRLANHPWNSDLTLFCKSKGGPLVVFGYIDSMMHKVVLSVRLEFEMGFL